MSNQTLSFKFRGIGEKNKDLLTGLKNKQISDTSLFIDERLMSCLPNCKGVDLPWPYALLNGKSLMNANLTDANLSYGNLTDADLTSADLTGANLIGANLSNANLTGAELTDAMWGNTTCPDGTKNDGSSPCTAEQLNLA